MPEQTLLTLIEQIQQSSTRKKSSDSSTERNKYKWTKDDEKLILKLLMQFGEDVSLIHSYFEALPRKQVKRKIREIMDKNMGAIARMEEKADKERRKSFFDQQILEEEANGIL